MLGSAFYMMTGKMIGKLPVPEAAQVAYKAAADGMVLLKNDGTLPLQPGKAVLFGAGAENTAFCGTGSGFAFSPYKVSVRKGLENAGFTLVSDLWLKNYQKVRKQAEKTGKKMCAIRS